MRGLAGRVFLSSAGIVCAVLLAAFVVASRSGRSAARAEERRVLEQAADLTAQLLSGRSRSLAGGARVFVQSPYFRALVAERRRDDILDQSFEAAEQLGADWVFITDERGFLIAKSDEPAVSGLGMGEVPLVAGALEGRVTTGFGASGDSVLFQAVGVPIVVPGGAPVGVLVATRIIDRQVARDVRAATGSDVVFYTVDAAGRAHPAASALDAGLSAAEVLAAAPAVRRGPTATAQGAQVEGAPYGLQGATLTTAGGDAVGGFLVIRPEEPAPVGFAGVRRSLLVAGALGLLLALAVAWSAARRITRPVRALAAAATRALDGEYARAARDALAATLRGPRDEVAALGRALTTLLDELRDKQALVAALAPLAAAEHERSDAASSVAASGRGRALRGAGPAAAAGPLVAWHGASPLQTLSGAMAVGSVVAERYALQQQVGAGGMGVVYRAIDLTLNETIALKALRPDLLAGDPRLREGLKHELRLTRRVSHRNVVRTHDFGSSDGIPFITMEYVAGESLGAILQRRGPLPAPAVLAIAKQLFRALEAAHEQGVVHGDLKPANVLLAGDGLLKVTDFGLASLVRRPRTTMDAPVAPPRLAGAVVGTPEYMAPELLLGADPAVRTDLYAAGVLLHECLTGTTPFPQDTPRAFLAHKLDAPEPELPDRRVPGAPPRLQLLLAQLTAREPAARPPSAAAVSLSLIAID